MTLNKNNLDIFVCSHKQFKRPFTYDVVISESKYEDIKTTDFL